MYIRILKMEFTYYLPKSVLMPHTTAARIQGRDGEKTGICATALQEFFLSKIPLQIGDLHVGDHQ